MKNITDSNSKSIKMYEWNDGVYQFSLFDNHPYYIGQIILDNEVVFEICGSEYETTRDVEDKMCIWVERNILPFKVYIFDYFIIQSPSVIPNGVKVVIAHSELEAIKLANISSNFTVNITHIPLDSAHIAYEDFDYD